jgi:predicted glycosyltransferase
MRARYPELRMIVVTGPRIDPAVFPQPAGLEMHGYIDRLYQHLCVCDLAIVQGGLTTTMELTAARRPFLYFPLGHHFEQNFHVRYRLDRYGAANAWTTPPPTPTSSPPASPNWPASPSATATSRPTARPVPPSS